MLKGCMLRQMVLLESCAHPEERVGCAPVACHLLAVYGDALPLVPVIWYKLDNLIGGLVLWVGARQGDRAGPSLCLGVCVAASVLCIVIVVGIRCRRIVLRPRRPGVILWPVPVLEELLYTLIEEVHGRLCARWEEWGWSRWAYCCSTFSSPVGTLCEVGALGLVGRRRGLAAILDPVGQGRGLGRSCAAGLDGRILLARRHGGSRGGGCGDGWLECSNWKGLLVECQRLGK